MINRVLIRMKVVQMLFSHFLNLNEFKLYPAPESASRDKQYAYTFYLDLLLITLRLSGYKVGTSTISFSNKYIEENKISRALKGDPAVKNAIYKRTPEAKRYDSALESIYNEITKSAIYRSYTHRKDKTIADETSFWSTVIETIFSKNAELLSAARTDENFTNVGYENGIQMLSDTIKSCGDSRKLFIESKNALNKSFDKAYELYNRLLILPVYLTALQDRRLDNAKNKYLATAEDLNPNMKFVDNGLVRLLSENEKLNDYCQDNHISWNDDPDFLMAILDKITLKR